MICPKCQRENVEGSQQCSSCGATLVQPSAPVYQATKKPVGLFVAIGVGILVIGLAAGAYFFFAQKMSLEKGGVQDNGTGTDVTETKTVSEGDDVCKKTEEGLLGKYKQDYDSCFKETNTSDAACQKTGGLADSYKENLNVMIILDSSGSMNETISGGKKMDIAKKVISNFVDSLPDRAWVGLMVYGHKGSNAASSKSLSCAGIEMVYPLSELNKSQFTSSVKAFQPTGYTPIAASLRKAKEILAEKDPAKTTNIIYLVSDGIETCDGDPVAVAKELGGLKVQTIVNIVGFGVDGQAQSQLKSAASAGGGEYYSANTADEMEKFFKDRNKYLEDIRNYRECIQTSARNNREEIQTVARDIRECIQTKARDEREGVQIDAQALREGKSIDWNCWNGINSRAYSKWDKINSEAYSKWDKINSEAYSEWNAINSKAYWDWSKENSDVYNQKTP